MAHVQKRIDKSRRTGKKTIAWQARYTGPDGRERSKRFEKKVDAERWLIANSAAIAKNEWIDPEAGRITLRLYAAEWLEGRDLRPTTRSKYDYLLDRHIFPTFGDVLLASVTPNSIRTWHNNVSRSHAATAAGAYRLLAAMFRTAVEDERIGRSPCKVKNASSESAAERPVATVAELAVAVAAVPARYRLVPRCSQLGANSGAGKSWDYNFKTSTFYTRPSRLNEPGSSRLTVNMSKDLPRLTLDVAPSQSRRTSDLY